MRYKETVRQTETEEDRQTDRQTDRQRQTDRLDFNVLLITQFHRRTIKLGHKTERILTAFPIFEEDKEEKEKKEDI